MESHTRVRHVDHSQCLQSPNGVVLCDVCLPGIKEADDEHFEQRIRRRGEEKVSPGEIHSQ